MYIIRHIKFSSTRRMMSMVVQMKGGKIFVFTKGADTAVLPLLKKESINDERVEATIAA